jgi:PhzF family phenazine biosynthesis protein
VELLRMTAFPDGPDGGNPAGVALDARGLDDAAMLAAAHAVGFSETAFVVDPAVGGDPRHLAVRYFSPVAEVPFCGHATIATAVAVAERLGAGPLRFDTPAGGVVLTTEVADGVTTAAFTSVPTRVRTPDVAVQAQLLGELGLTPADLDARYPLLEAFAGNWHPVVAVADRARFDGFGFDPAAVRALMDAQGWTGTVTVVHDAGEVFQARNLFPVGAITEDPATGSAAASLGAYLRHLGALAPPARFTVRQGGHVGRPSVLVVDVPAEGGITVRGTAHVLGEQA